jgi:hypothetical protein
MLMEKVEILSVNGSSMCLYIFYGCEAGEQQWTAVNEETKKSMKLMNDDERYQTAILV